MGTRRTRRYKVKRPLFAFGQLMLPLVAIVALGLLVVGIKLFFLPGRSEEKLPSAETVHDIVAVSSFPETTPSFSEESVASTVFPSQTEETAFRVAVPVTSQKPIATPSSEKRAVQAAQPLRPTPALGTTELQKGGWGVQIGAFTNREQAAALQKKARNVAPSAVVVAGTVGGKTYYRVRIPAGKLRSDAVALEKKLSQKGYPTLVVRMQ